MAALLTGCATTPVVRGNDSAADSVEIVERYLAALNRRDLLALTAYVHPEFRWLSSVGGELIVEVASKDELAESLRNYFERYADTSWRIESATANDVYLAVVERSTWMEAGARHSSRTLGVYEFDDGRIRRVTYFLPASRQ